MAKPKLRYGYRFETCPICKAKTFDYVSYSEWGYGTVEQHGYCERCGLCVEQAYGPTMIAFWDVKKGFKNALDEYIPKNERRHKRLRRKFKVKGCEINPEWVFYT